MKIKEAAIMILLSVILCSCSDDKSVETDSSAEQEKQENNDYSSLFEPIEDTSGKAGDTDGKAGKNALESASDDLGMQDGDVIDEEESELIEVIPARLKELIVKEAIVIDDTEEDLLAKIDGTQVDSDLSAENVEIPVFYSSDAAGNNDYVTPVRNQGHTALCWDYAALGAAESDLLTKHRDLSADSLNLSEKHSAFYNMHRAIGSFDSGIDDDYREFIFDENDNFLSKYDTSYLSVGGVTDYCLSVLTAWKGPVVDEDIDSLHAIKGQSDIYTQNADEPSDAYAKPFCHVQDVLEVPATAKNKDIIKRMIMEHGSVTASICADDDYWTGKKVALYDYKNYGDGNYADHEVLIVGWNDEYPAKNFITKPSSDGAFICKNSWGTKSGASGYFYLSYEDTILCNNVVAAYGCAMEGDDNWYDKNYQYAAFITHIMDPIVDQSNVVYMYDNNDISYGICFSPENDEKLSAVGYFSMATDINDKLNIYKLNNDDKNVLQSSEDGLEYYETSRLDEPIITMDCKSLTGGYHTFSLEQPIDIEADSVYLVVITPGKETKLIYEKAMDFTTDMHKDEWQHDLGMVHTLNTASGHSFMMDSTGNAFIKQTDKDFFVKVYTKE
ncbi:C1 family peptidase [Butyrivibrio sp. WCD3002]|uniref:C1 family peptidase n=1 Tax=Butyrivibrio sp. WCD3002 TaxID=1280676 RepID=UPI000410F1C5|nr:C1 family peptidase [Butyrivibrio sp. WCD3002]